MVQGGRGAVNDGTEVLELKKSMQKNIVLYKVDSLAVYKSKSGPQSLKIKKNIPDLFCK